MANALKSILAVPDAHNRTSAALLLLRVVAGLAMANHGFGKIKNPMHWMDKAPNPAPGFLQLLAAISEFGGGLAIAAGLLTPLAALGLICTMGYAINTHRAKGQGFQDYELAVMHLMVAVTMLVGGPGRFSADAFIFGKKKA